MAAGNRLLQGFLMDVLRPKVLVADDEPAIVVTLSAILQSEGYEVEGVPGGAEAIAAVQQHHYDLVLTDLKMPRIDGLAVLEQVRKCSPQTATIMMTGYASLDSAVEAVQRGAYEYLMKPIEVPALKLAIQRSLERKRLSEIETLYRVQKSLATAGDELSIAREVTEAACKVLNVGHAYLFLAGQTENGELGFLPVENDPRLVAELRNGKSLTSSGTLSVNQWARARGITDFALVPGIFDGELICVLCVHHGDTPYEFHAATLRFLRSLASQAALVLCNRKLITELRHNNSELEEANRKLKELDRLKSQFLSVATHELRTPLTVILGYNNMLAESLQDRLTAEETETLEESAGACKRLIRLVNSMLDVTQIESGRIDMTFLPTDARQVVLAVARLFRHEASAHGIHLNVHVPARLQRVLLDAERMQQVLVNLVGNALKFTPAGGQITLSLKQVGRTGEEGAVEFAVHDTGVGIPAEEQEHIFEEFSRAQDRSHESTRQSRLLSIKPNKGFGLGLSIARRIVQAHHGTLSVASTPGQGSTFVAQVPMRRVKAAAAEPASLTA